MLVNLTDLASAQQPRFQGEPVAPERSVEGHMRGCTDMLTYRTGDATQPEGTDPRVLVHVCNDQGHWGAGFVLALSRRFEGPEAAYRTWSKAQVDGGEPFELGRVQFMEVQPSFWVANLIGQHDIARQKRPTRVPPVRYPAIREGLSRVRAFTQVHQASVHMPRIGAGLAGGDWTVIERIIQEELADQGVPVTVYDLPGQNEVRPLTSRGPDAASS